MSARLTPAPSRPAVALALARAVGVTPGLSRLCWSLESPLESPRRSSDYHLDLDFFLMFLTTPQLPNQLVQLLTVVVVGLLCNDSSGTR